MFHSILYPSIISYNTVGGPTELGEAEVQDESQSTCGPLFVPQPTMYLHGPLMYSVESIKIHVSRYLVRVATGKSGVP